MRTPTTAISFVDGCLLHTVPLAVAANCLYDLDLEAYAQAEQTRNQYGRSVLHFLRDMRDELARGFVDPRAEFSDMTAEDIFQSVYGETWQDFPKGTKLVKVVGFEHERE